MRWGSPMVAGQDKTAGCRSSSRRGSSPPKSWIMALREQKQTGEKLGTILQRLGICSEKDIARVLAGQAGVELRGSGAEWIHREALDLVRPRIRREAALVAHSRCAAARCSWPWPTPWTSTTIDAARRLTGNYIEVVHAPESEIQDALVRLLRRQSDGNAEIPATDRPGRARPWPAGSSWARPIRPSSGWSTCCCAGRRGRRHRHPHRARGEGAAQPLPHRRPPGAGGHPAAGPAEHRHHPPEDHGGA